MRKTKRRTRPKKRTTRRYKKRNSKRKPVKRRRTRRRRVMKGGGGNEEDDEKLINTPDRKLTNFPRKKKKKANLVWEREKNAMEAEGKVTEEDIEQEEKKLRRLRKRQRGYPGPPYINDGSDEKNLNEDNAEWTDFITELQNLYKKGNKDLLAYPEYKQHLESEFYQEYKMGEVEFD